MSDKIIWTNEKRRLGDLHPWPINPRQIKKPEAKRLSDSLDRYGQVDIIAVEPDNEVVNGHQRLNVWMAEHGPDYEVDVRVASRKLTDEEKKRLTVYLHQGAVGEWDWDLLANNFEVDDLLNWGFNEDELGLHGFKFDEPPEDPGAQIDRAEELREQWGVELGQLWRIPSKTAQGEHRIICGDCTDKEVVERVMGGERAGAVVTDPPYNVAYSSRGSNMENWGNIENDNMPEGEFYSWLLRVGENINSILEDGGRVYLCHRDTGRHAIPFIDLFTDLKWVRSATIIWVKQAASMGWQDYRSQHECLSYGWKNGKEHYFINDRSQTTVWNISRDAQAQYQHPTQKPVELFEKAITNSTRNIDVVYDPFLGSGTTLIACERLGRLGRGIEISPAYVAVSLQRLADMGLEPELVET